MRRISRRTPARTRTRTIGTLTLVSTLGLAACSGSTDAQVPVGGPGDTADRASTAGTTAPTSGEVLALSYNVAGLPEPLSGSEPETNMPLIGPKLNAYDLVLVQESWRTPEPNPYAPLRGYHEELQSRVDFRYQTEPATQPLGTDATRPESLLADGLNTFSRYPLGPVTRERWVGCFGGADTSDHGAADCLAQKGYSVVTVTFADGVEVDVYDLHAEAGSSEKDQSLQVDDFAQLAAFINEHSAGRAIILGGDTNLHTDAVPENPQDTADTGIWNDFLAATGLVDVCSALSCPDPGRIDKFAFRSDDGVTIEPLTREVETEAFTRDDGEQLSDHEALAVRFRWTSG